MAQLAGQTPFHTAGMETLESRTMLAATSIPDLVQQTQYLIAQLGRVSVGLQSGTLTINGRSSSSVIRLSKNDGIITVKLNGRSSTFDASQVRQISITGGQGNDIITLDASITQPAKIQGKAGNDTIVGGSGADTIFGGNGDDSLRGGGGADRLFGEAGNDILAGGNDNDRLQGGVGRDALSGESMLDSLGGGSGVDRLVWHDGLGLILAPEAHDKVIVGISIGSFSAGDVTRTVHVPLGGQLVVRLEANASTPYQWVLTEWDFAHLVQPGDVVYIPHSTPPGVPVAGSGGTTVFTFDAVAPGQTPLTLAYASILGGDRICTVALSVQIGNVV